MPYYAVSSGNILRCVLADDPCAACVIAATQHINDEYKESCEPGAIFHVIEHGQSTADSVFITADHVLEQGGFKLKD